MYLVLASKSPRRRELLLQAGYKFQINVSNVDETVEEIDPVEKVMAIAKKKGLDIYQKYIDDKAVVLSADTIVVINNDILGKPKDKEEARLMIKMLQGNKHQVYTAVYIKSNQYEDSFVEKTEVFVSSMTDDEIEQYISTSEPYDKAGAYGIQGVFSKYISKINGDYYNVMGLPIAKVREVLQKYKFEEHLVCLACKKEINVEDEFCPHCGMKIKSKFENQICPICYKSNEPKNKFCTNCGKELQGKVAIVSDKNECMICHHLNKEGVQYCESCGTIMSAINDTIKTPKYSKKDYSKTALIAGIVSLACSTTIIGLYLSFIPGIIAIIYSLISIKRGYKGKCVLGLIFGILGILGSISYILLIRNIFE